MFIISNFYGKIFEISLFEESPSFLAIKYIYRVSQEECARLREGVSYVKV
jgi:hypothetical protein